ncbi:MAG: hypothetical protein WCJ19_02600 [bacterium]
MSDSINLIPQSELYTILDDRTPLYRLAMTYPANMCWLTSLFYALQFMGFQNNKKLHKKLSKLLSVSYDLMEVNRENGALMFVKKYELGDGHIKYKLNLLFKEIGLKIKVEKILSNITYDEIYQIDKYLKADKQLLTIIKNIDINNPNKAVTDAVPNHVILIKGIEDTHDGMVTVITLDPSTGKYYQIPMGVHAFIQWIQYIWVLERKGGIIRKLFFK